MANPEEMQQRIGHFSILIEKSEAALQDRPGNAGLQQNLDTVRRLKKRLEGQIKELDGPQFQENGVTAYHATYFAHELLKRCPSDSPEKMAGAIMDARVDLNPHQVEAALFAFKSPLSNGALLADEVGLGKTIEAGLVLSQKWAERKRLILIIVPASLRKQWNQEMLEKFYLPSTILEAKSFRSLQKEGRANPFDHTDKLVICSYNFARNKSNFVRQVQWDLVILDEAHRLRNVYKTSNKIAKEIKEALQNRPKLLLTATPLQNSLMELYGLVSIIDDHVFGDAKSFQAQFGHLGGAADYSELQARLNPVCKRTLRKQVLEYVKYTNRVPLTEPFYPTEEEQVLYDMVSDYLRRDNLQALPSSQRSLMTLVLRKLLASSTFAIAGALDSLGRKLRGRLEDNDTLARQAAEVEEEIGEDFEELDDIKEEWTEEEAEEEKETLLTEEEIASISAEIEELDAFRDKATAISQNAKGEKLLTTVEKAFAEAASRGAAQKAIIFTESRRTQNYLLNILSNTQYADGIVLFNGSNNDDKSKLIYKEWYALHKGTDRATGSKSADMRSALVDYFRNRGQIMIATEAAAEGINLQFCSLVINYDLPWNPQRIEQRIGRCHRYGQKHDVVVVNFLNKKNAADQRVFELLRDKFQLFSGVFGASDEVLGSIESGVDFEKRIVGIYQRCREESQIQLEFDLLRQELDEKIGAAMAQTRTRLLEHFDVEVTEKLRVRDKQNQEYLNQYETWLFKVTRFALQDRAEFIPGRAAFHLKNSPLPPEEAPTGFYELGRHAKTGYVYRKGHPLAQHILSELSQPLPQASLVFHMNGVKISILDKFKGQEGTLLLAKHSLENADGEGEDLMIVAAITSDGHRLDKDEAFRLFSLPADVESTHQEFALDPRLLEVREERINENLATVSEKNARFFEEEAEKLDGWAEDMKAILERELKTLDQDIREHKKRYKIAADLEAKTQLYRTVKEMESKRAEKRRRIFEAQDDVDRQKEQLLEKVELRLRQKQGLADLFAIRWKLN